MLLPPPTSSAESSTSATTISHTSTTPVSWSHAAPISWTGATHQIAKSECASGGKLRYLFCGKNFSAFELIVYSLITELGL